MGYIYKITNDINNKVYIGQTSRSIELRFKEHRESYKQGKTPLYLAMKKYGIEHFHVEEVEETEDLNKREIFWIEYYNSYKNGYNATKGGEGTKLLDYDFIIEEYKKLGSLRAIHEKYGYDPYYISCMLKDKGIEVASSDEIMQKRFGKMVAQYDLKNNYIQTFPSTRAAADSLNKISASNGAASHISDVCKGRRKSAYGYIWKFIEE